jgi:hypothetical protein
MAGALLAGRDRCHRPPTRAGTGGWTRVLLRVLDRGTTDPAGCWPGCSDRNPPDRLLRFLDGRDRPGARLRADGRPRRPRDAAGRAPRTPPPGWAARAGPRGGQSRWSTSRSAQAHVGRGGQREQPRLRLLGQVQARHELPHHVGVHPAAAGQLGQPLVRGLQPLHTHHRLHGLARTSQLASRSRASASRSDGQPGQPAARRCARRAASGRAPVPMLRCIEESVRSRCSRRGHQGRAEQVEQRAARPRGSPRRSRTGSGSPCAASCWSRPGRCPGGLAKYPSEM